MYQRSDRKNERRIFTMNIPNKNELTRIYGEAEKSAARFQAVADHFAEIYHQIEGKKINIYPIWKWLLQG